MLQQLTDNILAIIYRALSLSLDLIDPVSAGLYLLLMGVIYLIYIKRSRRLTSFVLFMGGVFFFFIIWNHPDYRWYKNRPWSGGYLYTLVMIMAYVYLPMKVAMFATELWRNLRLRPQAGPEAVPQDATPDDGDEDGPAFGSPFNDTPGAPPDGTPMADGGQDDSADSGTDETRPPRARSGDGPS